MVHLKGNVELICTYEYKSSESKDFDSLLLYLGRESNPNLIFRRDLFYPLNYQGEPF